MREVEAGDVDAGVDRARSTSGSRGRGADGGDDLGGAHRDGIYSGSGRRPILRDSAAVTARKPLTLVTAALAAAALASCGGGGAQPPAPAPRPPVFGFSDPSVFNGQSTPARSATLARRLGARVGRVVLQWQVAEPHPGRYDWRPYDALYRASLARGVKPLWIVVFAPPWARDPGVRCPDCAYPPVRSADGRWRALFAAIAARYPRSAGIEVWNEPNLRAFWPPRPDPARYAQLLREAHTAVAGRVPVVSAGPAPVGSDSRTRVTAARFLAPVLRTAAMDAVGVHVYPFKPGSPSVEAVLAQVRAVRGARRTPLWVTGTGATTTGPDRVSQGRQGPALVGLYRELARQRDVRMVLLYSLFDPPGRAAKDPERGYGVLDARGRPKPAACAVARAIAHRPCALR